MAIKALLDLNIWIDIAIRPNMYPESIQVFRFLSASGQVAMPLCGYTTLYYLLSKSTSKKAALEFMSKIDQSSVTFAPFNHKTVELAINLSLKDFEDSCVLATSIQNGWNTIITRNPKDFKNEIVDVFTPKQLLAL